VVKKVQVTDGEAVSTELRKKKGRGKQKNGSEATKGKKERTRAKEGGTD